MDTLELKKTSKKAEKAFNEDACRFTSSSFEVTALQFELRQHFPYKCTINVSQNKISYQNRDYRNIGSVENMYPEEPKWYKFDSSRFDLNKFEWRQVEDYAKEWNDFRSFWLYYDGNKPWLTQQNFIDYMNKLNYLESLMGEVSPFIKRYILVINRAYDLAKRSNKANN